MAFNRGVILGVVAGVVILAGALVFVLEKGDPGGPTADAVADWFGCETTRSEASSEELARDPTLGAGSEEAVTIRCETGEIPPIATVFRFPSEADARQAILNPARGSIAPRMCLVGRDVVTALVDEPWTRFCDEIGGTPAR